MRVEQKPRVDVEIRLIIHESEARALDALVGYGTKEFLKVFYEKLGTHYMEPHEKGLVSFFKGIRECIPPILSKTDDARKAFKG